MGSVCSAISSCCCCCCCSGDNKDRRRLRRSSNMRPTASPRSKYEFKATDQDLETDEPRTAEDRPVMTDFKPNFAAGESRYSIQKKRFVRPSSPRRATSNPDLNAFLTTRNMDMHEKLGSGAYSNVFRVTRYSKQYALKVIDMNKVSTDYKHNFLGNEIQVLKKLGKKQKNIIKTLEVVSSKNKYVFIIMEFAPNGTLADHLQRSGALNERLARMWLTKIVEAVDFMHGVRIAHRDLKLENILLTKRMRPKISDFSYAIEVKPDSPPSTQFCGSIPYFAPEILGNKPHNPLIADIWSLGVCFYIAINDKLPFDLEDQSLMLRQQLRKEWKHRRNVESNFSADLRIMIASMLEPDVTIRVTAAQLMASPWIRANL